MVFDTKQHFLKPTITRESVLKERSAAKRERVKNKKESEERERDFCDDDEEKLRSSVACFDGVRVRGAKTRDVTPHCKPRLAGEPFECLKISVLSV